MISTPTAMPFSAARAVAAVPLAGRQHRRHDHRAGMHRPALEGVVEILAVRRGAVDEGRARGAQRARVADRGAGAVVVPAASARLDVVLVARGDAEADHVDQRLLALARARRPAGSARRRCARPDARRRRCREVLRPCGQTRRATASAPRMRGGWQRQLRLNLSYLGRQQPVCSGSLRNLTYCAAAAAPKPGMRLSQRDHGEGEDQHRQAEHRDGAEVAAFLEVEDQHRDAPWSPR